MSGGMNASEEALARIWAEVLRLPQVEKHANFFEIGGDSLKAMEVIARVSEVLHVDLPLITFFEDPTVAHLAAVVSGGRSASEEALATIWAEVLRLPAVETDANFFDIGGDSLKAMEVIARVSESLHVDLPLIAFFEEPTVSHLAAVVDELKPAGPATSITRVADRHEFPLSYSQQMYWLLEQQNPGTGISNTPRIFRVHGKLEPKMLERSLNELRGRHEILQARFVPRESGPVQIVDPGTPLALAEVDLSAMGPDAREQAAMELALTTVREPFNLEKGPVLRARLVQLDAEDYLLCMAMHHIISDGFTGSILLDELVAIYDALASGEPVRLPPVELHFTDYAAWERRWMDGLRLESELEYWRSALRGAPATLNLPTDFVPADASDRLEHMRSMTVPSTSLQRLKACAQSNGTTLFTLLTAALRILLYRWSGQADFVLGTISSSRGRGGTERMIGCFVNPLPLRNPVAGSETALDLLNHERDVAMNAFAHQDCPFAKIVEAISPERTRDNNPIFNVALMLQNFPEIVRDGRCFRAEFVDFDIQVALLDLRFVALETRNGLKLSCEYKSRLFSEETIDNLLRAYVEVLQAITNNPAVLVGDIALPEPLMKQAADARRRDHVPTVVVAATFTAELVGEPLNFLLGELGMKYHVAFAPYQQVFQQLLDPASLVRTSDGFGVVLLRFEDWLTGEGLPDAMQREKLDQLVDELIAAFPAGQSGIAPLIVCFCPESRAFSKKHGWREFLDSLESKVKEAFSGDDAVYVIRSHEVLDLYPVEDYEDEYSQRLGNIPYTTDFFSALGTMLARRIWGIAENHYQVIAVACDDVLWSGHCGDKQPVVVDDHRRALQAALLRQRDAGMLLCLYSRSSEEDVWAAFDRNPEMPLQRDDFVATAIGPDSSSEGLRSLASGLGLELDSFIYLQSDAAECSEVEATFPEVLTLQAPADSVEIPSWLKHVWAFDRGD